MCQCGSVCASLRDVFVFVLKALRNLAAIGDEAWAKEVGDVFIGPLLAVLRLVDDNPDVQEAAGALISLCMRYVYECVCACVCSACMRTCVCCVVCLCERVCVCV